MQNRVPWKLSDLWRVLGATALLFFLATIAISFALQEDPLETGNGVLTFATFIIQELVFLIPIYALIVRKYKTKLIDFAWINIGWEKTVLSVLKGYGLFLLFGLGLGILFEYTSFEIPGFAEQEAHLPWFGEGTGGFLLAIVTLLILAPVAEE